MNLNLGTHRCFIVGTELFGGGWSCFGKLREGAEVVNPRWGEGFWHLGGMQDGFRMKTSDKD